MTYNTDKKSNLRKMRKKKNITQEELSKKSGVSARTIRAYEEKSREIDKATMSILVDLCIALDCDISDILESETAIKKYKIVKRF